MNNNEPAFPNPYFSNVSGMTLRDYIATHVLTSVMIKNFKDDYPIGISLEDYNAHVSYKQADAMLLERSKTAKEKNEKD